MPIPAILILDNPSIKLSTDGTVANLKELACVASHVEIAPDTSITTVDTFCGSIDYPGITKWSLILTLYQSLAVGATEEILSAAVTFGQPTAWEIVGNMGVISASNPAWSGMVQPQPYSPINGDAGEASTIELEWAITTGPSKRATPTLLMADEEAKSSKKAA